MITKKMRTRDVCLFQTLTLPFPCLTRYNEHGLHGLNADDVYRKKQLVDK